jgi:hypothetical protein
MSAPANRPVRSTDEKTSQGMEEGYVNSLAYQSLIEIWRNAAHAANRPGWFASTKRAPKDKPMLVFDFANVGTASALKRVAWNTGPHMGFTEVDEYFTHVGAGQGGGGGMWRMNNPLGDRHAGVRETLVPANPAGFVVLSYHPTLLPKGAMVWIIKDPTTNLYCPKQQDTGNTDFAGNAVYAETVEIGPDEFGFDWWNVIDQLEDTSGDLTFRRLGGVAIVLLGFDQDADDRYGVDVAGRTAIGRTPETATGGAQALLDKIAVPGLRVSYRYPVGNATSKGNARIDWTLSDGSKLYGDSRSVHGQIGWLETGQTKGSKGAGVRRLLKHQKGTWTSKLYPGLEIEWTMLDNTRPPAGMAPFRGGGHVVIRYRDEFMPTPPYSAPLSDLFQGWGVAYSEVFDRLRLVVRAPMSPAAGHGWFIRQDPTRSRAIYGDGTELPFDNWKDEWCADLPQAIQDEIDKFAIVNQDKYTQELALRILKQARERKGAFERMQQDEVEKVDKSTDDGEFSCSEDEVAGGSGDGGGGGGGGGGTGSGNSTGSGGTPTNTPDPNVPGQHRSRTGVNESGLPQPEWLTEAQWKAQQLDPAIFVYMPKHGNTHLLRFNEGHPYYKNTDAFWSTEFRKMTRSRAVKRRKAADITRGVKAVIWADNASRIVNSLQYDATALADYETPSNKTLTRAAMSVETLDHAIRALLFA